MATFSASQGDSSSVFTTLYPLNVGGEAIAIRTHAAGGVPNNRTLKLLVRGKTEDDERAVLRGARSFDVTWCDGLDKKLPGSL